MKSFVCLLVMLMFLSGKNARCQMQEKISDMHVDKVKLQELAKKRIFFGHQSVGFNIMDGVSDVIKSDNSFGLEVRKTKDPAQFTGGGIFFHDMIGKNEDPVAKVMDFKRVIENGIGEKVDIAFFKFCYVDVDRNTDIDKLFDLYVNTMDDLQKTFPNINFLHFTVPIRIKAQGAKLTIKRLVGMKIDEDEDAKERMLFNDLLRKKYSKTGKLFDLAAWESTYSDGKRNAKSIHGQSVEFLIPEYSRDGRHLNEKGRVYIATHLLHFLSEH